MEKHENLQNTRIGHVHLRVADLEQATNFYCDVLGFSISFFGPSVGLPAVFLAVGDYHHHIALNTFHSSRGISPPLGYTGLHHFAILYPSEISLAQAVTRVLKHDYQIDDARDHGATLSIYLRDIDGNGIELYYDRPRTQWFDSQGRPIIESETFDLQNWLHSFLGQSALENAAPEANVIA
jgi:catechol 2,3-dioxygenase